MTHEEKKRQPTHPGKILLHEFMKPLRMSEGDLAEKMDTSLMEVVEVIDGNRGVTPEFAEKLAKQFGTSTELWLNLQASFEGRTQKEKGEGREVSPLDFLLKKP